MWSLLIKHKKDDFDLEPTKMPGFDYHGKFKTIDLEQRGRVYILMYGDPIKDVASGYCDRHAVMMIDIMGHTDEEALRGYHIHLRSKHPIVRVDDSPIIYLSGRSHGVYKNDPKLRRFYDLGVVDLSNIRAKEGRKFIDISSHFYELADTLFNKMCEEDGKVQYCELTGCDEKTCPHVVLWSGTINCQSFASRMAKTLGLDQTQFMPGVQFKGMINAYMYARKNPKDSS
ncbi:apo-citrate lyase phosphoribosyl-dephospho-CoA transferase [Acrasis kona]|uniref:Apo-citrate lyase phosphoribosyl-dephospho-CoA transferase n=1 Tax=Acrasis kona TaxID=1008807 RepID=A0AAW2YLW6_9EUKA